MAKIIWVTFPNSLRAGKKNILKLASINSIRFPVSPLSDITGFYQETKTGEVNKRANKTDGWIDMQDILTLNMATLTN